MSVACLNRLICIAYVGLILKLVVKFVDESSDYLKNELTFLSVSIRLCILAKNLYKVS